MSIELLIAGVLSLTAILGLVQCFVGYRLFRLYIGLLGFIVCGLGFITLRSTRSRPTFGR